MGFSYFCMSYRQRHWLPLFQTIFSSMVIEQTYLPLEHKAGLIALQYNIGKVALWGKGQAC